MRMRTWKSCDVPRFALTLFMQEVEFGAMRCSNSVKSDSIGDIGIDISFTGYKGV